MPRNSWSENKKLLLEAHQENKARFMSIDNSIIGLKIQVERMLERDKMRSTVYGAIGGGTISVISMVIAYSIR